MEKVINPLVQLSPKVLEVKLNVPYGPARYMENDHAAAIQSLSLKSLAAIPEFMHHPDSNITEIQASYDLYRSEIPKVQSRLCNMESKFPRGPIPTHMVRPHSALQVAFLIINYMALVLNGILIGHGSPDDTLLAEESPNFVNNIYTLAKKLSKHRPLGASPIPMCLTGKRSPLFSLLFSISFEPSGEFLRPGISIYHQLFHRLLNHAFLFTLLCNAY